MGYKASDLHMPACPKRADAMTAHQQQLQREASESKWATSARTAALRQHPRKRLARLQEAGLQAPTIPCGRPANLLAGC